MAKETKDVWLYAISVSGTELIGVAKAQIYNWGNKTKIKIIENAWCRYNPNYMGNSEKYLGKARSIPDKPGVFFTEEGWIAQYVWLEGRDDAWVKTKIIEYLSRKLGYTLNKIREFENKIEGYKRELNDINWALNKLSYFGLNEEEAKNKEEYFEKELESSSYDN